MKAQIRNDGGAGYPTLTLFHENDTDRDILREIVNLHTDEGYDMTIGHTERFHGYYFNCPRCGAEVRPSMAKCHGAKVADAIQCPVCGIPATLSILEGRRDAMAMTWSCAYCFTSKTFKDEDLDDINAAQCPHCGMVNLFEEE